MSFSRKAFYGAVLITLLLIVGLLVSGHVISSYGPIAVLGLASGAAILVAHRNTLQSRRWLAIAAGALAGVVFWHAAPVIGTYSTVTLSVTGDKDPAAKSAEIWLAGVGLPSGAFSVDGFDGWAQRGNAVVGYSETARTVRVPKGWQAGSVLRMGRSPYSGIVEIAVDDRKSRIDLYSPAAGSVDFPLPPPADSFLSAPLRVLMSLLFGCAVCFICTGFFSVPMSFRASVVLIAVLTSTSIWLGMTRASAPGDIEFLAVRAPSSGAGKDTSASVFLGTAQGKVDRLPLPFTDYADLPSTALPGVSSIELKTDMAPLAVWKQEGQETSPTLTCSRNRSVVVEFDPRRAGGISGQVNGEFVSLAAPSILSSGAVGSTKRLFAVCLPYGDGLMLAWTSAYFRYNAWNGPVHAVDRIYLSTDSAPSAMLRLSSATGLFAPMKIIGPGEYAYASFAFPWNHAELARRLFTALIAGLCVLLVIPFVELCHLGRASRDKGRGAAVACLFVITAVWALFTMIVGWPSIIGWDAISPVIQHGVGGMSLWYGVGYPLLISAFINLGGLELSLLLKVVVVSLVVLWTALGALRAGARGWLINVWIVGMFVFTGTTMVAATELRDAVNGVALSGYGLLCFALLIRRRHQEGALSWSHYSLIALLGALIVLLRTDNIVYVGVLLAGFAFVQPLRRNLLACLAIAAVWLSATPATVRYVMESGDHGKSEMRLYKVSAFVNPLVGMLRGDALTPDERSALSATLEKVLKVDFSVERWTPSDVIYWHQSDKGQPAKETLAELQRVFLLNALRHPVEFSILRTATFAKGLGMDEAAAWLARAHIDRPFSLPPYFDHLGGDDAHWRSMVSLAGYRPAAHLSPVLTAEVYAWYERIALGAPQLLFAIALLFGFRRHPASSLLAAALITRAALFWLMQPASVFLYLSELQILGTLLPLLAWMEWRQRVSDRLYAP